uniref:Uncharacterized protein n=1 Tax=Plectus sambesii TaxID=2011161 RepID=A0A914XLB2_9BILA
MTSLRMNRYYANFVLTVLVAACFVPILTKPASRVSWCDFIKAQGRSWTNCTDDQVVDVGTTTPLSTECICRDGSKCVNDVCSA